MKKRLILSGLMMLMLSSCSVFQSNPAGELNAAQISFERVVRSLTILRKNGVFDESEADHITGLIYSTEALLIQWEEMIFVEKRRPEYNDFRVYFDQMLKELISYVKEQE